MFLIEEQNRQKIKLLDIKYYYGDFDGKYFFKRSNHLN